jgi:prepilin-type N-terminal cleavage/methylation domain-containing protein
MRNRGFSFVEVLFAVAILGIGFIMVAAIFPVAIMQTQATQEETIGSAVTRNGVNYLRSGMMVNANKLPYTNAPHTPPALANPGRVFSFYDPRIAPGTPPNDQTGAELKPQSVALWNSVRGNVIVSDDPRFAFVPLYVREPGAKFAKVITIAVRLRTRDAFKPADTERRGAACAELEPRPVRVTTTDGAPDRLIIENVTSGPLQAMSAASNAYLAAAPGAYVIISQDTIADDPTTPFKNEHGQLNGRIYRLGLELAPPSVTSRAFELAVGEDMMSPAEDMTGATAFIVGRGYASDAVSDTSYAGPNMAVQRYENVISLP